MPKTLKDSITYDVLFKYDIEIQPYKNKKITHLFKKGAVFMRGLSKSKLLYFYDLPVYEINYFGFGLGTKFIFNPRHDFEFIEVKDIITQTIKTTIINPENI